MANEPEITIVGNLTADPETKFTNSGASWTRFTIASTPRSFDRETSSWKDGEAMYLQCTAWRQLGENVANSLTKGVRVVATGRLRQRHWETSEGEKRSAFGLNIEDIGPSLKWATAQIAKAKHGTNPGAKTIAEVSSGTSTNDGEPPF